MAFRHKTSGDLKMDSHFHFTNHFKLLVATALFGVASVVGQHRICAQTPLDAYVAAEDPSYNYTVRASTERPGYTLHTLQMTSQTWRDSTEIKSGSEWQHTVRIIEPDEVRTSTALLNIQRSSVSNLVDTALETGAVMIDVLWVPPRVVQFAEENRGRVEDPFLAKSFRQFLEGGDSHWPALLPMTKSAVRSMDTTQDFMNQREVSVTDFVLTGLSKRGWTTWLTAAVDDRVRAILPRGFDFLKMDHQIDRHQTVYENVTANVFDGFSVDLEDYVNEGFPQALNTPIGQELLDIIDPFEFRDRLDLPKYLVHATGDGFFTPDSSQQYLHELPGPTYQRYLPNAGHRLELTESNLDGFFKTIVGDHPLPNFSWQIEDEGQAIVVDAPDAPLSAKLWQATNPETADFRIYEEGPVWTPTDLQLDEAGKFVARIERPDTGATAFMIELTYDVGGNEMVFTTDVSVLEPATEFAQGDFNENGVLDVRDLDILSRELREATAEPGYDLDGDGIVGQLDRNYWVENLKQTWFGDTDLDGQFTSDDLTMVFQSGRYEDGIDGNATWSSGDWNGDGDFDSGDLVVAFTDGGFEQGPRPAMNAVPESTSFAILMATLIGVATVSRTRQSVSGTPAP